jgi:universal stress protein E
LIVKSTGAAPYRQVVAAVDPFHTHAKPAELDRAIVHRAQQVCSRTGATLHVIHSYVPIEYFGADLSRTAPRDPAIGDARLEAVRDLCAAAGIPPDAARTAIGAPHAVLIEMQRRGEADLVVMGALARGRFAELILGHTAERVLHHGVGDVLVVNPTPRA